MYNLSKKGLIRAYGYISESPRIDMAYHDPLFFSNKFILGTIERYKNKQIELRSIHEELRENTKYTVLEFYTDKSNKYQKYYIDLNREYKVFSIIEERTHNGIHYRTEIDINYRNYDNVLFPSRIEKKEFKNGELIIKQELIMNDDWQINIDIDSNDFDFSFPKGLKIMDSINQKTYVSE